MEPTPESITIWQQLGIALALGLLVGVERGWRERAAAEGTRIAGIRTFGLIALLGALSGLAAKVAGEVLIGFVFVAFAALMIAAHVIQAAALDREYGITTVVASLITFILGALVVFGMEAVAAAVAVITTVLLGLKPVLHEWLRKLEAHELFAGFKLLLISVVILPILPNRGMGPWEALNPYQLWWLVVLIAGISFVGYFAIKLTGPRRGIGLTGLFGGLASSTAVTLTFSRLGRTSPTVHTLLAAGVVVAAVTMFPRVLVLVSIVNAGLLPLLVLPLIVTTLVGYGAVAWLWLSSSRHKQAPEEVQLRNPFELMTALKFAGLLTAVMLLARLFQIWFGETGVYALAALSGIGDVDAITVSLADMARGSIEPVVAARGILIAAAANTAVKAALVVGIAGGQMAWRVTLALGVALAAGIGTLLLIPV